MSYTLTIRDESVTGSDQHEWSLDFLTEQITVRELIRSRVYQEVGDYNLRAGQEVTFRGLVQPSREEAVLNSAPKPRQLDWKRQFEVALEAFERGGFLILVDQRQATDLDEKIEIRTGTAVSFVKLTPLVGG